MDTEIRVFHEIRGWRWYGDSSAESSGQRRSGGEGAWCFGGASQLGPGRRREILRRWIKEFTADPRQAFPGQGQVKPEQQEIDRLLREVAKLKKA